MSRRDPFCWPCSPTMCVPALGAHLALCEPETWFAFDDDGGDYHGVWVRAYDGSADGWGGVVRGASGQVHSVQEVEVRLASLLLSEDGVRSPGLLRDPHFETAVARLGTGLRFSEWRDLGQEWIFATFGPR